MLKLAYASSYKEATDFANFVNAFTMERYSEADVDMLCVEVDVQLGRLT